MPKYVIERELPGAGNLTAEELQSISTKSNGIIGELGPGIQWVHSYVGGDRIYCVHLAANREIIEEHARCGGFPVSLITEVSAIIDPTTGGV